MPTRDANRGPGSRKEETRGRKPAPKKPAEPLPVRPAGLVTGDDLKAYTRIRKQLLAANSHVGAADVELVIQAAILLSDFERLRKDFSKLDSLISIGGNGNDRVNPLYEAQLKAGTAYRAALGQLLMTPRSRSASRLAKGGQGGGGGAPGGTPDGVIPATTPGDLRLFGG